MIKIIKLNSSHIESTRHLFEKPKYMGTFVNQSYFIDPEFNSVDYYHEAFYQTYLSDLKNFHSFGAIDESGKIQGLIAFYESTDEAAWYGTNIRNCGNKQTAQMILDEVLKYNEKNGRLKFYTLWSSKHAKLLRKFAFSQWANDRYDYFDEYLIEAGHRCIFNSPWQILFNMSLIPVDTIVRCTFLKQDYRKHLYNAGRL